MLRYFLLTGLILSKFKFTKTQTNSPQSSSLTFDLTLAISRSFQTPHYHHYHLSSRVKSLAIIPTVLFDLCFVLSTPNSHCHWPSNVKPKQIQTNSPSSPPVSLDLCLAMSRSTFSVVACSSSTESEVLRTVRNDSLVNMASFVWSHTKQGQMLDKVKC